MQYHLSFDYDVKNQTMKAFNKIKELVKNTGQTSVAIYVAQERAFYPEIYQETQVPHLPMQSHRL